MKRTFALVAGLMLVMTACSLRPRFKDFAPSAAKEKSMSLVLLNNDTGAPVPGAKVEAGESKNKVSAVTDAQGGFTLPVTKALVDDNALLIVSLPAGVTSYRVERAPQAPAPVVTPAAAPAEKAPPTALTEDHGWNVNTSDAGVPNTP